ncbi:transcription termination factor Rho [Ruficoccus amylovorans]|uniref:Transcription termination factor Rho n=2 Tax=Ruficoccus amylovorans TaxID=1804625 RepID=A0A842HC57_9BACT|nr:transcription termination factor Rho [Ruficoccus amylovorans]
MTPARSRKKRVADDEGDIPQAFSADPDDVDDYGDRQERNRRKDDDERSERDDRDERGGRDDDADERGGNRGRGGRERSDEAHNSGKPAVSDRGDSASEGSERSISGERSSQGGNDNYNRRGDRPDYQNRQGGNDKFNRRDKNQNGKGQHWQPKGNKNFKKGGNPNFQPGGPGNQNQGGPGGKKQKFNKQQRKKGFFQPAGGFAASSDDDYEPPVYDSLLDDETLNSAEAFDALRAEKTSGEAAAINFNEINGLNLPDLEARARELGAEWEGAPSKKKLLRAILEKAGKDATPVRARGIVELAEDGYGFLVYQSEQYRVLAESAFIHSSFIERYGLQRGHIVDALLHPARENESCPFVIGMEKVMDGDPEAVQHLTPFTELVPYYPLERILLECPPDEVDWDNKSMRIVDLLTPIGLGQRGLIVAPPRTGKTVLMQGMAKAITKNRPNVHLIILLIDERPEEVTDFRRQVESAEVICSTFDESAESHVHAAEMVIEKSRRMVESGKDVVILLDSITRLARAYNTLMPSSGKILSGGVEAGALQKPKRFFGSARNIEGGGSLTILGTALVDTGSKMDEVIFEEFKGTGNMELHLDRELVNKRIYPALNFEKSGTRKEELLYHPHEMEKIYGLRRAMKGVPSTEAMEMLINRIKKTKTNAEFLMTMGR